MRKAFLIYRKDHRDKWRPQIYYDEFLHKKYDTEILGPHDISHYVGEDNEVSLSFARLDLQYLTYGIEPVNEKKENKVMSPQAVTGFLTSNGKYFPTEWEANLYEQSLELNNRVTAAVVALRESVFEHSHMDDFFTTLPEKVITFINVNEDLIRAYINARQVVVSPLTVSEPSGTSDGVGGQTTISGADDDSRVRVSSDLLVGEDEVPEEVPPSIGGRNPSRTRK